MHVASIMWHKAASQSRANHSIVFVRLRLTHRSLGSPPRVHHTLYNISIRPAAFAGLALVTNRVTDTPTDRRRYVCSNGPHLMLWFATRPAQQQHCSKISDVNQSMFCRLVFPSSCVSVIQKHSTVSHLMPVLILTGLPEYSLLCVTDPYSGLELYIICRVLVVGSLFL